MAKTVGAQVFMPDFFGEGKAYTIEKFENGTKEELNAFIGGTANPPRTAARLVKFAEYLRGEGFKKIGALGYCWGNA